MQEKKNVFLKFEMIEMEIISREEGGRKFEMIEMETISRGGRGRKGGVKKKSTSYY